MATSLSQRISDSLSTIDGIGGNSIYADISLLPLSGNSTGDQAFVSATNRLYLWNGAGWFNIALINTSPSITTGPNASYEFAIDGTPIILTLVAEDPEGIAITWSYAVTTGSLGSTATVSQSDNVFTITPSTNEADIGAFGITFTASDGINLTTAVSSFSLVFGPPSIEYLIVAGGGAGGGGTHNGGGGGAGGLLTGTTAVTSQTYVITIGAGGTGITSKGSNGSNSSAFGLTATGGGAGGRVPGTTAESNGEPGGSGGGGSQGGSTGGSGIVGQGNDGGGRWWAAGAGGGGAGYAVPSGTSTSPYPGGLAGVSGGDGISSSISGIATYYAGGGGGGQRTAYGVPQGIGGNGGGGNGGTDPGVIGFAGAPNTGGGGGGLGGNLGAGSAGTGGDGGSGIVIIRYSHTFSPAQATTGSATYTVSDGYRIYTFTSSGSITF